MGVQSVLDGIDRLHTATRGENPSFTDRVSSTYRCSISLLSPQIKMKVVDCETPGGPDVLQIKELPIPTVDVFNIMIKVEAAGLNVFDTWLRQDIYRSANLGYECSGKVIAVGSKVREFEEGDEVCAYLISSGAYAEFVVVPVFAVLRIPSTVSLLQAATLPEASRLTIFALSVLTNVTPGKTFLIHGAAGGFDIIAIQYIKHIGCKVFVVAGTEEKLKLCKTLGAEVCINYREEDFCKRVKAETGGKGVDFILDDSGRDHFKKYLDCLARSGSLVILGHKSRSWVDIDLSYLMEKDIRIKGVDLQYVDYGRIRRLWSDVATKVWPLIEDKHIKPIIGKTFTFNEAAEAHRALEENKIPGKLLLVPR